MFQNENVFVFEQHDNYDDFDFDIEIKRLFEFSNVVFIIKKTKATELSFSKILKNQISTSRSRVVKKSSFFWWFRFEKFFRIYATKKRTILLDEKKIKKRKKKNELRELIDCLIFFVMIMFWEYLFWETISSQNSLYTSLWKNRDNFSILAFLNIYFYEHAEIYVLLTFITIDQ